MLTAPGLAQGLRCDARQEPMLEISLAFGRNTGDELGVSEDLFAAVMAFEPKACMKRHSRCVHQFSGICQ
jgi:hypothetical protein